MTTLESPWANDSVTLSHLMMSVLEIARSEGLSLEPDPDAINRDGKQWRWTLPFGPGIPIYSNSYDIVSTILACDCTCPGQCGRTVVRMCGWKSAAEGGVSWQE